MSVLWRQTYTRASHAKHTDDVRAYRASSDKIAAGAIPAAWRLVTAWKSPQCVHVYKNVLEFGYRLALGACRPRLSVTGIIPAFWTTEDDKLPGSDHPQIQYPDRPVSGTAMEILYSTISCVIPGLVTKTNK